MKKIILIAAVLVAVTLMSAPGKRAAEGKQGTRAHRCAAGPIARNGPCKAGEEIEAIAPTVRSAGPRVQLRDEDAEADNDAFPPKEEEIWRQDVPLRAELQQVLLDACAGAGIDPLLMLGLIEAESGFNEDIVSATGDYGLCQLSHYYFPPDMTPEENLRAGAELLGRHIKTYGDVSAALTAYNRGHDDGSRSYANAVLGKAIKWGYIP